MFQFDYTEGKQSGSIITVTEHCSVNSAFELTAEEFDSLFNGQNENGDQQSSKLIQNFFFHTVHLNLCLSYYGRRA